MEYDMTGLNNKGSGSTKSEIDNNSCELCGSVDDTYIWNLSNSSGSKRMILCKVCSDNIVTHRNNYTLICGAIMNKRWDRIYSMYTYNMRRRHKGIDAGAVLEKFWRERLAMFNVYSSKPENYAVKLYIERYMKGMSIAEVLGECSRLFRDPDVFNERMREKVSRKEREVILGASNLTDK